MDKSSIAMSRFGAVGAPDLKTPLISSDEGKEDTGRIQSYGAQYEVGLVGRLEMRRSVLSSVGRGVMYSDFHRHHLYSHRPLLPEFVTSSTLHSSTSVSATGHFLWFWDLNFPLCSPL